MDSYIVYSRDEYDMARGTNIAMLLERQGETVKQSGKEYAWRDGPARIVLRENLWYSHYEQEGGDAVSFVRRFFNLNHRDAIAFLLDQHGVAVHPIAPPRVKPVEITLPKAHRTMDRVFAYLMNVRGIDREVLHAFAHHKMLYESYPHHNVVFVGYDPDGKPRHAHLRSTATEGTFRYTVTGSVAEYSFHWIGTSDKLFVFEAPIDMLSYITMHPHNWRQHSYVAACSVSDRAVWQLLNDCPHLRQVYIGFDNDEGGQPAAKRLSDKLFLQGYQSEILVPTAKDWNEDLVIMKKEGVNKWEMQSH